MTKALKRLIKAREELDRALDTFREEAHKKSDLRDAIGVLCALTNIMRLDRLK
jgi:hypothetical protein